MTSTSISEALKSILTKLAEVNPSTKLIAVSKFQSSALIREVYDAGHRAFGENYVQELLTKASELPSDIEWHFIGHLQSNKCKQLVTLKNLAMVHSVDSLKLARSLQSSWLSAGRNRRLDILLQVNTSGEISKGGIEPPALNELARAVLKECPDLHLRGLMTIGDPQSAPEVEFQMLRDLAMNLASELDYASLDLSMGMSGDFEVAARMGSNFVRVGSAIFGERKKKE